MPLNKETKPNETKRFIISINTPFCSFTILLFQFLHSSMRVINIFSVAFFFVFLSFSFFFLRLPVFFVLFSSNVIPNIYVSFYTVFFNSLLSFCIISLLASVLRCVLCIFFIHFFLFFILLQLSINQFSV